ncbi:anti-sigma factor [Oceanospirillum sediminis]|uniref:Regulator of SigK n=1 Tax=Oceanospirillum sediminis TaxID=2760088 RepID=A0A839IR16_9GAMM|nr:anti-sigma factor [Oceanospirillum sediminis]MBB1486939.1 anti-sigma factor [Oceanospirillum sediminis]
MHESIDLTDPEQRNQAAAEYVLGTLSTRDKAAFEALLAFSPDLQQEVSQWREHLQTLNDSLPPISPPRRIWQAIEQEIHPRRWFESLKLWQLTTAVSFSFMLALGSALVLQKPAMENSSADYVYVVNSSEQKPAWLVNTSMDRSNVMVQTVQPPELDSGLVCKLWLKVNGEYVMLGTLPHEGLGKYTVPSRYRQKLVQAEVLVSIEPMRGKDDPDNMGPVVDRGNFMPMEGSTRRF